MNCILTVDSPVTPVPFFPCCILFSLYIYNANVFNHSVTYVTHVINTPFYFHLVNEKL